MSSKRKKAVNMLVRTILTQREIANKLDMREETLSRWKNEETFQEMLKKEESSFLRELTAPALRTIKSLLNANSEYVQLQAAQDILDRTGYKPSDKLDITSENVVIIDDI